MLSRLSVNSVLKSAVQLQLQRVAISTTPAAALKWGAFHDYKKKEFEKCPPDYKEYPERDLVNFPRPERLMWHPKVRMGFIPDSWFNFFYYKTGVTGPYVLGAGIATFLLSKELYIVNGTTTYLLSFIFTVTWMTQFFRKPAGALIEQLWEETDKHKYLWRDNITKSLTIQSEQMKDMLKCSEAWAPMVYQAQREIYLMAMEAEYRRRLEEYKNAVKRKLDYFVDLEDTKRRYQRRHVVDWVVDQVKSGINDQVQKAALAQCVLNLKTLSQKAH